MNIRQIQAKDDEFIFNLIRSCLEDAELNIPGTAYFDESIKKMSEFYLNKIGRNYFGLLFIDTLIENIFAKIIIKGFNTDFDFNLNSLLGEFFS